MFSTTETKKERCLDCLPQIPERNYRPHAFETRLHRRGRARESGWPIRKILQYYHVRRPSLYRWLRRYGESGEGGAPGPSPQAEVAPSRVDPGQGRLQDQMPFRQIQIQRDAIGRDLGQGHGTRQQGREEPQDRPGEILQNPLVPFPQGPEGAGGEMGERIQRNAQDDA